MLTLQHFMLKGLKKAHDLQLDFGTVAYRICKWLWIHMVWQISFEFGTERNQRQACSMACSTHIFWILVWSFQQKYQVAVCPRIWKSTTLERNMQSLKCCIIRFITFSMFSFCLMVRRGLTKQWVGGDSYHLELHLNIYRHILNVNVFVVGANFSILHKSCRKIGE